jgi:aminoglycoside phosphotransferase (APT) family kinase protein
VGKDQARPEWRADLEVDEGLVRRLLGRQFAGLETLTVVPFAEGWDNALWLVNGELAFRFPRRAIAVPGVEREIRLLPDLARRLPFPIPNPVYVGRPSDAFPWPFFGAPLLSGSEPARVPIIEPRSALGAGLGAFLRTLHDPALAADLGEELPYDPMGRADMAIRVPRTRDRLDVLRAAGLWSEPPAVERLLTAAVGLGPADGFALVHGDLHLRHLLVDDDGRPSAVIDWGDVCLGDPSIDLSLYWSLLDAEGRSSFRDAYGDASLTDERLLRARVLALFLNAALAHYAADTNDRALLDETLAGLRRTLVD